MPSKISSPSSVVAEFGFTLDQVNWLGNVVSCIYLPTALVIPTICSRYGIRRCVCTPQLVRSFCWTKTSSAVRHRSLDAAAFSVGTICGDCVLLDNFKVLCTCFFRTGISSTQLGQTLNTTLTMSAQCFSSIAQPIFQILGPKYSEAWFDLKGRTTATMIISIGCPYFSLSLNSNLILLSKSSWGGNWSTPKRSCW